MARMIGYGTNTELFNKMADLAHGHNNTNTQRPGTGGISEMDTPPPYNTVPLR